MRQRYIGNKKECIEDGGTKSMNVIITGSGGCVSTPRACCNCRVCTQARLKGFPYARTGCSLFIEEANVLIDTPEDINDSLNHAGIQNVEHILYSHCDPDHTMGMRVIEQLKMDWLAGSVGKKPDHPIEVASLPAILEDIRQQGTKSDKFQGADVLIIGNAIVGDVLKDGFVLQEDNPLRKELFTLDEIEEIREQYAVPEVIITHLEEDWGKSYDDYRELEKEWKFIRFAYDGLKIPL